MTLARNLALDKYLNVSFLDSATFQRDMILAFDKSPAVGTNTMIFLRVLCVHNCDGRQQE